MHTPSSKVLSTALYVLTPKLANISLAHYAIYVSLIKFSLHHYMLLEASESWMFYNLSLNGQYKDML